MNLYAWQPDGHGDPSYFVMAESEEEARTAVELSEDFDGWTIVVDQSGKKIGDYYELTILKALEIITNDNS